MPQRHITFWKNYKKPRHPLLQGMPVCSTSCETEKALFRPMDFKIEVTQQSKFQNQMNSLKLPVKTLPLFA